MLTELFMIGQAYSLLSGETVLIRAARVTTRT